MKKFFIILPLIFLIGCATYKPVSTMYDWELQNEYNDLQLKHMQLEREMIYGGHTYKTRGGYDGRTPAVGWAGGLARGLGRTTTTKVSNPAIKKLNKVENRMRKIELEMSRRGGMPELIDIINTPIIFISLFFN